MAVLTAAAEAQLAQVILFSCSGLLRGARLPKGARLCAMTPSNSDSWGREVLVWYCITFSSAAYDADTQAFDNQFLMFEVDFDGGEFRVLRQQPDLLAVALETLDGHLIADPRHHDLAVAGLTGGVHGQQVTVVNADVLHAHAVHTQQIIGAWMEKGGADLAGFLEHAAGPVSVRQQRRGR